MDALTDVLFLLRTSSLYFGIWCLVLLWYQVFGRLEAPRTSMKGNRVRGTLGSLSPLRETRVELEAVGEPPAPVAHHLGDTRAAAEGFGYLGQLLLLQTSHTSFEHLLLCSLDFVAGQTRDFLPRSLISGRAVFGVVQTGLGLVLCLR